MTRLDRYILRQLIGPFLFFVLVFTGVIWLSQSLRVIDMVVNNGQSAGVFLEFTVLLLPMVMSVVLPVAGFATTLYAINRLFTDSEVVVMFAAGLSGTALLRPIVLFSLGVTALLFAVTLYLMPTAKREMRDRLTEIRGDVAAIFLREGAFVTPVRGVTVYLREIARPGEMLGIFVHDERDSDQVITYTAERALLAEHEGNPHLIMINGLAQSVTGSEQSALSLLRFDRLSYDLSALEEEGAARARKPSEFYLPRLLRITEEEAGLRGLGAYRAEAHEALSAPLYAIALPMLGVAFVVAAGFRRQGFTGRIVLAAAAAVALRVAGLAAKSLATTEAALWPTMYLPPLIAIAAALWMLSARGLMVGRRRPGTDAQAGAAR